MSNSPFYTVPRNEDLELPDLKKRVDRTTKTMFGVIDQLVAVPHHKSVQKLVIAKMMVEDAFRQTTGFLIDPFDCDLEATERMAEINSLQTSQVNNRALHINNLVGGPLARGVSFYDLSDEAAERHLAIENRKQTLDLTTEEHGRYLDAHLGQILRFAMPQRKPFREALDVIHPGALASVGFAVGAYALNRYLEKS